MSAYSSPKKALKDINNNSVFQVIYDAKADGISKQEISIRLGLSLPTINHILISLLSEGKIIEGQKADPSGGRPAQLYCFNSKAKIAIGIEIRADRLVIASVDLNGIIEKEASLDIEFNVTESYFLTFGSWANSFIDSLHYSKDRILGVSIAIQGIVSEDGNHIVYGDLLRSTAFTKDDFSSQLDYPITLVHDSEMAAHAELWHLNTNISAIYMSLNPNLGAAMIIDGNVVHTRQLSSGTPEHMLLHPNGKRCYCGKLGCADAYCSANSLISNAMINLPLFFEGVRNGNTRDIEIWDKYMDELSLFIDNIRMVFGVDIILGGLVSKYMCSDDFIYIQKKIDSITTFKGASIKIFMGYYEEKAVLIGAALTNIKNYLSQSLQLTIPHQAKDPSF